MTIRAARQMPLPLLFLSALVLSNSLPVASAARDKKLCPPDPYLNPKQDICNPLRYIASNTLTSISFSLILVVGLIQTFYVFRWGAKYMLAMVIGCYSECFGRQVPCQSLITATNSVRTGSRPSIWPPCRSTELQHLHCLLFVRCTIGKDHLLHDSASSVLKQSYVNDHSHVHSLPPTIYSLDG